SGDTPFSSVFNTPEKTAGNKATPLAFLKGTRLVGNVRSPFSHPQGSKHTESLKMDAERFNSVLSSVFTSVKKIFFLAEVLVRT
ncbi:hypothetical protein P3465_23305, partial [Vibrio parahaemolyticus]|nr:hypothetical protein [Vibrio parahaemolyticus]